MDKIIEHVGEKGRANAIESLMRLLYCEEVRLKLEERKSKFNYNMRSVLDLVMKIESGRQCMIQPFISTVKRDWTTPRIFEKDSCS